MVSKNKHTQRSQCPIACGLDMVGDHWTLLIVRDLLLLGRHEFRDMLEGDEGISSNILSDRLSKLQQDGLVSSLPHPESKRHKLYYLTPKGKDLIHVLVAMARWSLTHMPDQTLLPSQHLQAIQSGQKGFIQQVLDNLAQWEQQYGIHQVT